MFKIFTLIILVAAVCDSSDFNPTEEGVSKNSGRQKRLLFYDEEGNLVKTYKNPYLYDFAQNAEKIPFLGNFFNPFFSFLRPSTFGGPTAHMIPVSDEVIQQINNDPVYQNKLLTLPRKELVVEPNPLCADKRSQIPSKSCRNFLNCWDGWAFEQECPEGLLFSKEGYCDYPHNVDCSTRINEAPMQVINTQCSKEFESFRSDQLCSEFFVCVDRVPVRFKCPADLAYDQELGICDYPSRVNCNSSKAMDEPSSPSLPAPPAPPSPPTPSKCSESAAKDPASSSAPGESAAPAQMPPAGLPFAPPLDIKSIMTSNSVFNSQSWSSTHMAISRQDAIRQLQLGVPTNVA